MRMLQTLCVVLIVAGAAWTRGQDLPAVGVNPGAPIWGGNILFGDALGADIELAGCRFVRVNFRIDGNATWTPELLAKYDTIIQTARAHDLQVLGLICYEAVYAGQEEWNENYNTTGMNAYITTFADTAWMLIDRYKDDVKVFELWNEPSCWSVQPSTNPLNPGCFYIWPKCYANLLAETYKRCIEQGGAAFFSTNGISLSTGGLFAHDIGGGLNTARDYMTQVYAQTSIWNSFENSALNPTGRRYPWDYFGYHFYIDQGTAIDLATLGLYFDDMRDLKSDYSDPTPFLVTEFGWNTLAVSEQLQADNLRDTYNWLRSQPDIAASFWYQWNNGDGDWGLVYSIGNPKPAYYEFAAQCGATPLSAAFYSDRTLGSAPLTVQFTSSSVGVVDTYAWTFGDGGTSAAANPQHIYNDPGIYTVTLTITGPGGTDSETKTDLITVTQPALLADRDGDGDGDLADFAIFALCFSGSGGVTPTGCSCDPALVTPFGDWESAGSLATLSAAIATDDLLAGNVGTLEAGGFHEIVPGGSAGGLVDLTDGVAGATIEAVLADYATPSLQVRYSLATPRAISAIRVFAANDDGRVFQDYDVYYSTDGGATYQALLLGVTTGPFGQVNNAAIGASLTTVAGETPGAIALGVNRLRFTFYDVSAVDPAGVFWDPWGIGDPADTDGNPAAYVGSIIKEIDVFAASPGNRADLDGDGDGDAADFELFEGTVTGPQ